MDIPTILNHLGEEHERYYNAVAPPLIQSSNFCVKNVEELRHVLRNEFTVPFYTRGNNPTVAILRKKIAALEGAGDALVFASGTAAITASVMSVVKGGDHVVCVQKPYSWTNALLNKYLPDYGVKTTMVDARKTENIENALTPATKLIYLESPNSITFELQDIEAVVRLAKQRGITTVIDNSYSSPLCQSPLSMGVDLVLHSASKYFGGHSDLVAGVVCGSKERIGSMFAKEFMNLGGIISPHDAWLMLRSIRTLELRVNKSAEVTQQVVDKLENHPKIEKINYPFAKSNPQLALAKKQMKCGTGLFSLLLKADEAGVERFVNSLTRFVIATSWGGYESLVFPFCAMPEAARAVSGVPANLVRLYIGIDETEYLMDDLLNALARI
ncbi:MAG: aminotransferase class I/II-fold pyridoxal phosphate-dependent enzyme [Bacteroidia bacterium]|nr:aminotransferase class I/II-fold pyridoxal phosphate-dependent enzyme [Bacteroidia bacterium]